MADEGKFSVTLTEVKGGIELEIPDEIIKEFDLEEDDEVEVQFVQEGDKL